MDEATLRLLLIGSAVVLVAVVVAVLRIRQGRPTRVDAAGLDPGVYLFTSPNCLACRPAREAMVEARGEGGFTEVSWDQDRERFARLGVGEVPATLLVDPRGRGRLYRGVPRRRLRRLDP